MLAIFTVKQEAVDFSSKIHEYLKANRPDYNATHWSGIEKSDIKEASAQKSDFENKWYVKVPEDYQKWPVKLAIKEVKESVPIKDAKIFLSTWVTPIKEVLPIEIIKTKKNVRTATAIFNRVRK